MVVDWKTGGCTCELYYHISLWCSVHKCLPSPPQLKTRNTVAIRFEHSNAGIAKSNIIRCIESCPRFLSLNSRVFRGLLIDQLIAKTVSQTV